MDELKEQLENKITANILMDKCSHCKTVIFQPSWCTQDRCIRFTTPFFRALFFDAKNSENGKWNTGDYVMYEVHNLPTELQIECVVDLCRKTDGWCYPIRKTNFYVSEARNAMILRRWILKKSKNINLLFDAFDIFLNAEIPVFENFLSKLHFAMSEEELLLKEGTWYTVLSSAYERNPIARQKCIEAHGTACSVCGMRFEDVYGSDFADIIEVHHIVPLSQIKKGHVVDPIRDLVPVCPNCHTALHSKKDGVYTVEELKAVLDI